MNQVQEGKLTNSMIGLYRAEGGFLSVVSCPWSVANRQKSEIRGRRTLGTRQQALGTEKCGIILEDEESRRERQKECSSILAPVSWLLTP